MKTFLLILFFIANLQAEVPNLSKLNSMAKSGNTKAKLALMKLQEFGLIKENITTSLQKKNKKFPKYSGSILAENKIKKLLQSEIRDFYIPKLERSLGTCLYHSSNECIHLKPYPTAAFKNKTICMPFTTCDYYKCMEKKYKCQQFNINYFTKLAHPTCSQYLKNIKKEHFSDKGIQWIYSVMVCLQKGLTKECDVLGKCPTTSQQRRKTCQHIVDFTLKFHPGCYLNSAVGICHLPFKDKLQIWKTVSPFLTKRERKEAIKVALSCIF